MVNINPFYKGQAQARQAAIGRRAVSPERFALMKAVNKIMPLRVMPAPGREHLRSILRHPNGTRLRREGSVEWPNDRYTQRRIADGDIIEEPKQENAQQEKPAQHARRGQPAE
jgi:hypothetical protein